MSYNSNTHTVIHNDPSLSKATFAGGCFWCMEPPFEKLDGVITVLSGYSGGDKPNPTYSEVSSGVTGHVESIQIYYDANKISYSKLLEVYWQQIDPTDENGSFVDRGKQYRSVIFYHNDEQKKLAEKSKEELGNSGRYNKPIVTEILPYTEFYLAEEYHQDYYKKNPIRYKYYRNRSGRDQYLEKVWSKNIDPQNKYILPTAEEIKSILTPLQYKVTREEGTEKPFDNEYWDNKEQGIYVDILTGEPLFSSLDKYDSGTGWPSFTHPIDDRYIIEKEDNTLFTTRTEVRSKYGDNHLGHVFLDGPEPTGLRYCMNSAALKFIPFSRMEEEGYGEYVGLFE